MVYKKEVDPGIRLAYDSYYMNPDEEHNGNSHRKHCEWQRHGLYSQKTLRPNYTIDP